MNVSDICHSPLLLFNSCFISVYYRQVGDHCGHDIVWKGRNALELFPSIVKHFIQPAF